MPSCKFGKGFKKGGFAKVAAITLAIAGAFPLVADETPSASVEGANAFVAGNGGLFSSALAGGLTGEAAFTYDAVLTDSDGGAVGTATLKTSKKDKSGNFKVTASIRIAGGGKFSLKGVASAASGEVNLVAKGGSRLSATVGADGVSGSFFDGKSSYVFLGARNPFLGRDAAHRTIYSGASAAAVSGEFHSYNGATVRSNYKWDLSGRHVTEADTAFGATNMFSYSASGQPTAAWQRADGETRGLATFEYGAKGLLVKATNPLGGEHTFHRDADGYPLSETTSDGATIDYAYDGIDRLAGESKSNAAGETVRTAAFIYDACGNRICNSLTSDGVTEEFANSFKSATVLQDGRVQVRTPGRIPSRTRSISMPRLAARLASSRMSRTARCAMSTTLGRTTTGSLVSALAARRSPNISTTFSATLSVSPMAKNRSRFLSTEIIRLRMFLLTERLFACTCAGRAWTIGSA